MNELNYVLRVLDEEWRHLGSGPHARRRMRLWQAQHPNLATLATPADLVTRIDDAALEESSDLLWTLLEIGESDDLAFRSALQVIVPGLAGEVRWLLNWAQRFDVGLIDDGDIDQLLILAAVEAVDHALGQRRAWPIKSMLRRTHRIILRETGAAERWYRQIVLDDRPQELRPSDAKVEVTPARQLLDIFEAATARGRVSNEDVRLVWLMNVEGLRPSDLAETFGASQASLRQRRYRTEARLADFVGAA